MAASLSSRLPSNFSNLTQEVELDVVVALGAQKRKVSSTRAGIISTFYLIKREGGTQGPDKEEGVWGVYYKLWGLNIIIGLGLHH